MKPFFRSSESVSIKKENRNKKHGKSIYDEQPILYRFLFYLLLLIAEFKPHRTIRFSIFLSLILLIDINRNWSFLTLTGNNIFKFIKLSLRLPRN